MMDLQYQPQLIVGYDSQNATADLIHVSKAQAGKDYYCPCCGNVIRPRALDSEYKQPHYYHLDSNCSRESQIHWMYKYYLFEEGSQFYIEDCLYTVQSIEIEKVWNTSIGNYKPDITIYTKEGTVIYFELFFSNNKDEDYLYKWQELDNDVVEVDIKRLLNLTEISTPRFEYLYHDGRLYTKEYHSGSLYASTIGKRKEEIRREDYQSYKEHWAKLDWFYQLLKGVLQDKNTEEELFENFSCLELEDMYPCYEIIKKTNCVKHYKDEIKKIISDKVLMKIENHFHEGILSNFKEELIQISPYRYGINIKNKLTNDYISFIFSKEYIIKFKSSLKQLNQVEEILKQYKKDCKFWKVLKDIYDNSDMIKILEDKYGLHINITNVLDKYKIIFKKYNERSKYYRPLKEVLIKQDRIIDSKDLIPVIEQVYEENKIKEEIRKDNAHNIINAWATEEIYKEALEYKWRDYISLHEYTLLSDFKISPHAFVKLSKDKEYDACIALYIGNENLYERNINAEDLKNINLDELYKKGIEGIEKIAHDAKELGYYINKINNCKNKCWVSCLSRTNDIYKNKYNLCIILQNTQVLCEKLSYRKIQYSDHILTDLIDAMKGIIQDKEFYGIGIYSDKEVKSNEFKKQK